MTEAEWQKISDPYKLLHHIALKRRVLSTMRKLRLTGCAFVQKIRTLLEDDRSICAADFAERFADGRATIKEIRVARKNAKSAWIDALCRERQPPATSYWRTHIASAAHHLTYIPQTDGEIRKCRKMVIDVISCIRIALSQFTGGEGISEFEYQCEVIRDVFGNPFRPITINHSWCTTTVIALATGIYNEKSFDRMPILADALQDAGCDNAEVLNHCRQPAEHVRGCWVVDLLLGKQ